MFNDGLYKVKTINLRSVFVSLCISVRRFPINCPQKGSSMIVDSDPPKQFLKIIFEKGKIIDKLSLIASNPYNLAQV